MPLTNVNNIELFYDSVGVGPSIVFVHGGYGGASSSVLPREDGWVDDLKNSYNVITYDRRSAGRSSYPISDHSIDIFVDDLTALLQKIKITKFFLIGSSSGGPVALKYCLRNPEALIGLILANTSARLWNHGGRATHLPELKRRFILLKQLGPEKTFDLLNLEKESEPFYLLNQDPNPLPPGTHRLFAAQANQTRKLKDKLPRDEKIKYFIGELLNLSAYIDADISGSLSGINVPTLVLHGDADTQVPYHLGMELSAQIKGSRFVTIPGAGHGVMRWPEAVNEIKRFCDQLTGH